MHLSPIMKVVQFAHNDDTVRLRADESHDVLGLLVKSSGKSSSQLGLSIVILREAHM